MKKDQETLTKISSDKALDAIGLVEASLNSVAPYQVGKDYSPKEREPYDALSDRFIRAVEISIKFFKSYERFMYGESSDTLRDLLNKMEKLGFVSSVMIWMQMRDVRSRIVHDYLPEEIKEIYDSIMGDFGVELINLQQKISELGLTDKRYLE
jgi:hypothetical protein